jgi:hypothetical protein
MAIDTIKSSAVLDGAIATADIADDAVTSAKIDSTSTGMTLADLTVDTNTLKVDASNNRVGIGVTSPDSELHLATGSKIKIHSGGDSGNLEILNGGGTTKFDLGGGSASQNFRFSLTSNTGSFFTFTTNTGEILRISNNGLHIGGTSNANALDDYEEGTFTPASGSGSLSGVSAFYTKIGNVVRIGMKFSMPSSSSGSSATISGLPFTCFNDNAARAGIVVSWNSNSQGNAGLDFLIGENSTAGTFYIDGSSRTYANLSSDTIYLGGTYITNT